MALFERIFVITKKTALQELQERFNTREQARFYIEHMGGSFSDYEDAHIRYELALQVLSEAIPDSVRCQFVERSFVPNLVFGGTDLIVTLGPDGLVVNTAKYVTDQPIVAFNPDPSRIDGVLIPFHMSGAAETLARVLAGRHAMRQVSMARAQLNDGQRLYAVNDLFVGQRTHVSARYELRHAGRAEAQSSSGIIVSTGAGSTGWLSSVQAGATAVVEALSLAQGVARAPDAYHRLTWEADLLIFAVREPFVSNVSSANITCGYIQPGDRLQVVSHMPQNGVIFSDGIEADYIEFNSGAVADIMLAERKVSLVVG